MALASLLYSKEHLEIQVLALVLPLTPSSSIGITCVLFGLSVTVCHMGEVEQDGDCCLSNSDMVGVCDPKSGDLLFRGAGFPSEHPDAVCGMVCPPCSISAIPLRPALHPS